jgi:hypothetical protein
VGGVNVELVVEYAPRGISGQAVDDGDGRI